MKVLFRPPGFLLRRLPELLRCESGILFKYFRKIALILEAYSQRNVDDGKISVCKKPFAFLDADHVQVLLEGRAGTGFKQRREVGRM